MRYLSYFSAMCFPFGLYTAKRVGVFLYPLLLLVFILLPTAEHTYEITCNYNIYDVYDWAFEIG
jgi:hypothetical protein